MSNHKSHSKKWLISRLKTSGSKRKYVLDGAYAETRHSKGNKDWENLPKYEGMGRSFKFFNGKINYGLLVRFLRGKVGEDWQQVHPEILERIPTNLLEYKDCIQWFVADLVEKKQDGLWDKRAQKYLKLAADEPSHWTAYEVKEFYVDPDSSLLVRVEGYPF